MSTHIIGFRPPDDKWKAMKACYDACQSAGISVPAEVEAFFDYSPPDESGVEVAISYSHYSSESRDGFEIQVSEIPKDVTVIRFFNRY